MADKLSRGALATLQESNGEEPVTLQVHHGGHDVAR